MRSRFNAALAGCLLCSALLSESAVAQSAKPTLLQRVRELIGLNRPIAAGGSRSSRSLAVCIISPRTEIDAKGQVQALVTLPRPTILAADPLNEVRINRGDRLIWRQQASSTQAIEGPINWPVEPIQPGDQLTLLLRPRGASGGDFARIKLNGASAAQMNGYEDLVQQLGSNAEAWLNAIDSAMNRNQVHLAWALLFTPQVQHSVELDELRREVLRQGCGE
jgi:hypothetical protein